MAPVVDLGQPPGESRGLTDEQQALLQPCAERLAAAGYRSDRGPEYGAVLTPNAAAALSRARARPPRVFGGIGGELYGYSLMALSSVAFGTMTLVVHVLGSAVVGFGIPSLLIVWVRSLMQLTAASVYITFFLDYQLLLANLTATLASLLVLRGVVGSLGMICLFTALSLLPLGDAITLFFLGPIFTMVGTHLILREQVSTVEGVSALIAFGGVALVAHGTISDPNATAASASLPIANVDSAHVAHVGVLFALGAAVFSAGAYTIVRQMHTNVHFMFSVFSFGLSSWILTTTFLRGSVLELLAELAHRPIPALLLVVQGLAGFAGQCALNKGLQHCRGVGVLIRNIDVPIAYLIGVSFFHEVPSLQRCIGTALILMAVLLITIRQVVRS